MPLKEIHEPVFDAIICLIWNCSGSDAERQLYRKYNETIDLDKYDLGGVGIVWDDKPKKKYRYVIYLRKHRDQCSLVHEIHHLVRAIMKNRNIEDEEAFAHYQDYWFRTLNNAMGVKLFEPEYK